MINTDSRAAEGIKRERALSTAFEFDRGHVRYGAAERVARHDETAQRALRLNIEN